ncbi:hypothetical protein pb186bvf_011694 [Paramecium bursaria]
MEERKLFKKLEMSPVRQIEILPPLFPGKIGRNFNEKAGSQKIDELMYNSTTNQTVIKDDFIPKRTQSLYSLLPLRDKPKKQFEKKPSPTRINQYNKWYMPPSKRFVDQRLDSEEYKQLEKHKTDLYIQHQRYNSIILQSKHIKAYIEEFRNQHKRSPIFIH